MAELTVKPRVAKRSPLEVGVDKIWRFFCSVRAAVYEIAFLTLLVLVGTLRGSSVPNTIAELLPFTRGIVDAWYGWDVFHSLIFMGLLALISIAIAICTMNRAPGIWQSISSPKITTTHGFIRNAEVSATYSVDGSMDTALANVTSALRKRRFRILTEEHSGEIHIYADRFRYGKLGTFPFHLALIMILVGGIVGARYGFRDNEFLVPEGSLREVGHGTGISVQVNRFTDTYYETGTAEEYRTDLTILKDGEPVKSGSITVNHPITFDNTVIYQASFGQAVQIRITDKSGNLVWDDSIPTGIWFLKGEPNPVGIQELPPLNSVLLIVTPNNIPMVQPTQEKYKLLSGEVYFELRPTGLVEEQGNWPQAKLVQGKPTQIGDYTVEFVRERQYSLMQVASNPGIPIFWAAALLLVGGLGVSFYFPHRRIRGIIATSAQGVTVALAPLAKRDWSAKREFGLAVTELTAILGREPQLEQRDNDDDAISAGDYATGTAG